MAYDFSKAKWFRVLRNALLGIDSWIDSTFYSLGVESGELWRDFSAFMERFHARGATRVAADLACEALTLGVFGGLVMVALAQPAFRLTAARDWLKQTDLAVTFEDRYGKEVGRRGILHDDAVPLDEYPDYVIQAVLATEDRRFYDHWGVDPIGLLRALTVNARASGVVQGGSTLTQQLAKNLFLSNERTLTRKINEAFLAFWLESHLSKKQILRLYLDRAYMGGGTFGIQAAAQFYFGRSIKDVTLAQAAMLAGLFKAPTKFAPSVNLPAARARANEVLNNMVIAGYLRENQIADALRHPASPVDRGGEARRPTGISTGPSTRSRPWPTPASSARTACSPCARRSIPASSKRPRTRSTRCCARMGRAPTPIRRRPSCCSSTARCGRWSAGATMPSASSTASPTPTASRARPSSPMSISPP